ncbi:MAG: hypothetical protein HY762_05850 [Planctomycetes bacterium]|nr:hypothetical protein [Planctomycetota bacterium]
MNKWRRGIWVLLFVLMGLSVENVLAELRRDEIISQTADWFKPDGFHQPFEDTGKEFIITDNPVSLIPKEPHQKKSLLTSRHSLIL